MWTIELFEKTRLGEVLDGSVSMSKEELIEYADRQGAPRAALDLLGELEDGAEYDDVHDIWPDMPSSDDDFGWSEDE